MSTLSPVVDAHHHLWRIDPSRTVWPAPEDGELYRDFYYDELAVQLDQAGVDRTILVQTEDSDEDTDFLLAEAALHPRIAGVVGWLPLHDSDRAAERLDRLSTDARLIGIRCLVHRIGDDNWLSRRDVDRGLALLEGHSLPYDVVTDRPTQLRHVADVAARHPQLLLVIDHLAKPPVGRPDRSDWQRELERAARHPTVYAKLSGLYPVAGDRTNWTCDTLRPYVELALELFGAERLMVGSDWPVCLVAGGYTAVWTALRELVDELAPTERDAILGGNAARVYGLAL